MLSHADDSTKKLFFNEELPLQAAGYQKPIMRTILILVNPRMFSSGVQIWTRLW